MKSTDKRQRERGTGCRSMNEMQRMEDGWNERGRNKRKSGREGRVTGETEEFVCERE